MAAHLGGRHLVHLQQAGVAAGQEPRAIVQMLLELFLICQQLLAMRAGSLNFFTISLEVINGFLQGYFHFIASSKTRTFDLDQTIIQEIQGVLLFHSFRIA